MKKLNKENAAKQLLFTVCNVTAASRAVKSDWGKKHKHKQASEQASAVRDLFEYPPLG